MIQSIQFNGLKNTTAAQFTLFPLTLITGPNGGGKTTILDAITLAALGYHPDLGKTSAATMDLAKGNEMSVRLTMASGHTASRTWKRTGKSTKAQAEGCLDPTLKALADAITVGRRFLASSPINRAMMLQEATTGDLTEQTLAAINEKTPFDYRKAVPLANVDHNEWVEAFLENIKAEKAAARAVIDRMNKGIQAAAHLELDAPTDAPTREEVEAARNAHHHRERELAHMKGQRNQLATIPEPTGTSDVPDMVHLPAAKAEAEKLAEQLVKLRSALSEATSINNEAFRRNHERLRIKAVLQERDDLVERLSRLDLAAYMDSCDALEDDTVYFELGRKLNEMSDKNRRDLDRANATLAQLAKGLPSPANEDNPAATCHHCGAKAEHWDTSARLARIQEYDDLNAVIRELSTTQENLQGDIAGNEEKIRAISARNEQRKLAQSLRNAKQEQMRLALELATIPPLLEADTEALELQIHELTNQHEESLEMVNSIMNNAARAEAIRKEWDQYREAQARITEFNGIIERMEAEAEQLAQAAHAKARAWEAAEASRTNSSSLAAMRKSSDDAAEQYAHWTAIQALLTDITKALTEKALAPILVLARRFTDGILPSPLGNRGFEIGRWTDEQTFVPLSVFSGAEKAITKAALDVALAQNGSRIAIIDEFSTLDHAKKAAFLPRLVQALRDKAIDQAIIFDNGSAADLRTALGDFDDVVAGVIAL